MTWGTTVPNSSGRSSPRRSSSTPRPARSTPYRERIATTPEKARARDRPLLTGRVESVAPLTPTLTRIVLGGEGLAEFELGGFTDHYVKLQFPRAGAPA